ncbi:hypothetical protein D3C75_1208980 [compost metagenome]
MAEAFGGVKLMSDRIRNRLTSSAGSPPAPVSASTSSTTVSPKTAGSAVRMIWIGANRRTRAALICAPTTSPTPFTANTSANWLELSPKPSRSTNGEPTT